MYISEERFNALLDAAGAFGKPDKRAGYIALYNDNAAIYDTPAGAIKQLSRPLAPSWS